MERFDWPGKSAEEMFRYNRVINEYEFPPLEVLHFLLISLRLGRHYKGAFRLTKKGAELARSPGRLFAELIPYFVLRIDHASYARFDDRPFGKWDVWMNVINVEADQGTTEGSFVPGPSMASQRTGTPPAGGRWAHSHHVFCGHLSGRDC